VSFMAIQNTRNNIRNKIDITDPCPRCGGSLLTIKNRLTKWITCPDCRYKRLEGVPKRGIVVKGLR